MAATPQRAGLKQLASFIVVVVEHKIVRLKKVFVAPVFMADWHRRYKSFIRNFVQVRYQSSGHEEYTKKKKYSRPQSPSQKPLEDEIANS